ncbi:MAG: bifunctional phosphopantothenoylcysteine decarboxylase/phosphopantothenate--cysteine ligase CoaBC [Gammaproteobacteria bacterium]
MNTLAQKNILLGITGGIAAYKSAELARRLRERGANVQVVMTAAAQEFITPLTLQAVSGNAVRTELFDESAEAAMGHIELARWADAVVVAPASADFLARLAHGHANDLLTTICLATNVLLSVAPAMNQQMWQAPATEENIAILRQRGVRILGPAQGAQACGEFGPGRMLEPEEIADALAASLTSGLLAGRKVVVTAGPTREPIDPVRYISNRSSGRMGYALAHSFQEAGAQVTLISGPVALPPPARIHVVHVTTAAEMADAVTREISGSDIFVAAAAVADYRSAKVATQKLKKSAAEMTVELERNPDILASVAQLSPRPFVVGFAAETEAVAENARDKLVRKQLDLIAANDVSQPGIGFDSDENALQVFWADGGTSLPRASKSKIARDLVKIIAERYLAKN